MQRSALCRSRRELSNAYILAKFGFDTAENEPCKVCRIQRRLIGLQAEKNTCGSSFPQASASAAGFEGVEDVLKLIAPEESADPGPAANRGNLAQLR